MIAYQPVYQTRTLASSRPSHWSNPSNPLHLSAPVPPPLPDFLLTGYTGLAGWLEGVIVLGITGAAAWVGIKTGLDKKSGKAMRIVGWAGGGGSALLGLLYIAGKTGVGQAVGLPAVRVTPD
jgi:hypothetical protein